MGIRAIGRRAWARVKAPAARPWLVLLAMVAIWVAQLSLLVYRRHERFGSFAYDMGIYDQAGWLASRGGDLFLSVRGLEFFGHHATIGMFLFAPAYWLGAGAHFLNIFQVLVLGLGAVPVYLIARDRLQSPWMPLALAAAYLLHPVTQFLGWELFHPESVAVPILLFAWWFAMRRQWWWFAASAGLAVLFKEDVALSVAAIGVVLLLRRRDWRIGLFTAVTALSWFVVINRVVIPANSPTGEAFYNESFRSLGETPTEVAMYLLAHPSEVVKRATKPDAKTFIWRLGAPYAFVPAAAPAAFAAGAPQAAINLMSDNGNTRVTTYHYSALPLAGLTIAMVEGLAILGRRPRQFLVGLIVGSAVAATMTWGPLPIGADYRKGRWPLADVDPRRETMKAAVGMIPKDAAVTATYFVVPHLSHRRQIYMWPVPWKSNYWGMNGENLPDTANVDWLVIDMHQVAQEDRGLVFTLVNSDFKVRLLEHDIVVAERVSPGSR